MSKKREDQDGFYQVGFGKPPKDTQFRKGVSGNPSGRPKGSKNVASILAALSKKRIRITTNGRSQSVTMLEAIMMQLTNRAAGGDLKAIREVLGAIRLFVDNQSALELNLDLSEHDKIVMKNLAKRFKAQDGEQQG
jgi:hypothetical protein